MMIEMTETRMETETGFNKEVCMHEKNSSSKGNDQDRSPFREVNNLNTNGNGIKMKPKLGGQVKSEGLKADNCMSMSQNEQQTLHQLNFKKCSQKSKQNLKTAKYSNSEQFMIRPINRDQVVKFDIQRMKRIFSDFIQIKIKETNSKVLSYQKKFSILGHKIVIELEKSLTQKLVHPNPTLAFLQGNFNGSIFNLHQIVNGIPQVMATFEYQTSISNRKSPRNVNIYLKTASFPSPTIKQDLRELYNLGAGVTVLSSKIPQYNKNNNHFMNNFDTNEQVLGSVHNVVLVDAEGVPGLKMYQVQNDRFTLECLAPFTPLIGAAFAISSFLFKLATQ